MDNRDASYKTFGHKDLMIWKEISKYNEIDPFQRCTIRIDHRIRPIEKNFSDYISTKYSSGSQKLSRYIDALYGKEKFYFSSTSSDVLSQIERCYYDKGDSSDIINILEEGFREGYVIVSCKKFVEKIGL